MRLKLDYGGATIAADVSDAARVTVATPKRLPESRVRLAEAVEDPVAGPPLSEFVRGRERVLVVVNDATRATPTEEMLDAVLPLLDGLDVRIAVAAGAHGPPTEEELGGIMGRHRAAFEGRTILHDARSVEEGSLGTTSYGTPVTLSGSVAEADAVIALTTVEPHYMAGFTGGRKSLVPGLASYRTIEMNHRLAIRAGSEPLRLDGNPLNEDLEEAADMVEARTFSVNGVMDGRNRIVHAACGAPRESLRTAAANAREVYAPPIDEAADIAVAAANHPLDRDLYQAQKAIENVAGAVADGGIVIVVSRCSGGVGPRHYAETLEGLATEGLDPEAVFQSYRLGHHKPVRMARLLDRVRVWGVTEVPDETLRRAMVEPFPTLQDAVDRAQDVMGADARVLWVPKASVTVPLVR